MTARHRFVASIALLAGISLAGTVGYMAIERTSLFEAAYMTVITISTVGYDETIPLSAAGRVFTMVLVMVGVGSVFYATVSLTTLFVEGDLKAIREKRKLQKSINELRDHVIVCGYGRMGGQIARQLRAEGQAVVSIDIDADKADRLDAEGELHVRGDAAEESTLRAAGIERARSLVASLPSDSDNVFVVLTARGLRPDMLLIARAESISTESKLLRAGADRVVCPQIIGAYRMSSLILRPNVVDFVDVAAQGIELEIDEYDVSAGSPLAGKSLRDSALRQRVDAMVVAIKRPDTETLFNPRPEEVVQVGDILIMIGRLGTSGRLSDL